MGTRGARFADACLMALRAAWPGCWAGSICLLYVLVDATALPCHLDISGHGLQGENEMEGKREVITNLQHNRCGVLPVSRILRCSGLLGARWLCCSEI